MVRTQAMINAQRRYRLKNKEALQTKTNQYVDKYYYTKNWESQTWTCFRKMFS